MAPDPFQILAALISALAALCSGLALVLIGVGACVWSWRQLFPRRARKTQLDPDTIPMAEVVEPKPEEEQEAPAVRMPCCCDDDVIREAGYRLLERPAVGPARWQSPAGSIVDQAAALRHARAELKWRQQAAAEEINESTCEGGDR